MGVVARASGGTELGGVFLILERGLWDWILPGVVRIEAGVEG